MNLLFPASAALYPRPFARHTCWQNTLLAVMIASCITVGFRTLQAQTSNDGEAEITAPASRTRRTATTMSTTSDNLGVRYLKLGNSYREARNYDLAQTYIKKGLEMVKYRNSYWEAVGYEYLGLLYRDMGDRQMALEYLRTASSLYDRVVTMRNSEGSDQVLRSVIADVEQGVTPRSISTMPLSSSPETMRLQDDNRRLQDENRYLSAKINDLELRIRQIENGSSSPGTSALGTNTPSTTSMTPSTTNPGLSLRSSMSVDMSECKRDLEGIARYRESTLWLNGYAPIDFSTRDVRPAGGNTQVDGTVIVGYLKRGESAKIDLTMPVGQYIVLADGCSQKARDIDVRIINQAGVVLERKDIRFNSNAAALNGAAAGNGYSNGNGNGMAQRDSTSMSMQSNGNSTTSQTSTQPSSQDTQTQRMTTDSSATPPVYADEALRSKPSNTREALAKLGWNNEYGGVHTFLITMYDCDPEGAYFCFLIGKK
jgi:Tetratricopeptide repeat